MRYEYSELPTMDRKRIEDCLQSCQYTRDCAPSEFLYLVDGDLMERHDLAMVSKNDRGFLFFPNMMTPPKKWGSVLRYITDKDGYQQPKDAQRAQLYRLCERSCRLYDELRQVTPSFLKTLKTKGPDRKLEKILRCSRKEADTTSNEQDVTTATKNAAPEKPKPAAKKGPKYPLYTAPMLDAIREAIDASDVKERYADAWNGFTVGFPKHGDGSAIQIDFAPKDGASYGISPITVQKAGSYSKTGEVKRIVKRISGNLPLTMTDKAIEDGVSACLEAIRTQIEGNAPWTVPSDLIDFVGDWTLNSYKDIIEDADEPLDRQQAFAVEHASRDSGGTASIPLIHGTRVIYNPTSGEFAGFDGNFAYTAKRTTAIMENAEGYRAIKRAIAESGISPSDCKFRCANWEFNLVDVIISSPIGEMTVSVDTNGDGFTAALKAKLDGIREESERKTKAEDDALIKSQLIGRIVTDAVIETIHSNNRITSNTIVKLLRGLKVNRSYRSYTQTRYEGKLKLVDGGEIERVVAKLHRIGILDEHDVQGDYGWFTVETIDDSKYDRYRKLLVTVLEKDAKAELAMSDESRWTRGDGKDDGTGSGAEGGENTNPEPDADGDTDGEDAAARNIEIETDRIAYLIGHPAVMSLAWDAVHGWLTGLDPATVKYLSVMKKLEQDRTRKSLINRILDAATGDDKKKAAKKAEKAAEKAASAAKGSGGKGNGKKSKIPPHRIECVSMGRKYGRRYVVVSEDGKVLDDAQGYGFRSPDAAERCFAFQQSGKGKEVRKAEEWWKQKAHRKILSTFENEAFYAAKEGRHILVAELKLLLELYGIDMDAIGIKPSMLIKGAENLI